MVGVELKRREVAITFGPATSALDVLRVLYFYKNNPKCVIYRIKLFNVVGGVTRELDITRYKDEPIVLLAQALKAKNLKRSVESSHVRDSSREFVVHSIRIYTLNDDNEEPVLMDRGEFLKLMFEEFVASFS